MNTTTPRWLRQAASGPHRGLAFGADYNPEQWPREVWAEDVRLMREAGVNIVSLAIFSWARSSPAEDTWDFGWLDEVMDLLHANGIGVDLATATASPPPWLTTTHPEILPVTARRRDRVAGRPPALAAHLAGLPRARPARWSGRSPSRYADHPALVAWHVSNELGCHNVYDYSDDAARAFRDWLRARYGTLDALNHAWGTAFWSQRYGDWDADPAAPAGRLPPQPDPAAGLQALLLRRAARTTCAPSGTSCASITPDVPVTTNFMVMGEHQGHELRGLGGRDRLRLQRPLRPPRPSPPAAGRASPSVARSRSCPARRTSPRTTARSATTP